MSAGRSARRGLATALMVIASSTTACDEPNEPNAIQPADFQRTGEDFERSRAESDSLGTTEIAPLPGDEGVDDEPPLATPSQTDEPSTFDP